MPMDQSNYWKLEINKLEIEYLWIKIRYLDLCLLH